MPRFLKVNCEQADDRPKRPSKRHKALKRRKNVIERRKAKRNPEAPPAYGKYRGYET